MTDTLEVKGAAEAARLEPPDREAEGVQIAVQISEGTAGWASEGSSQIA